MSEFLEFLNTVFDKSISTVIPTLIGASISIYLAQRNFKRERQLLQEQLDYQKEQFKSEQDMKIKLLELKQNDRANNEKRLHLENSYELLSMLKSKCSITSSYIAATTKTVDSFNKFYSDEIVNKINKIEMSVGLYFPNLKNDINNISHQANLFWGHQQEYLRNKQNVDTSQDDLNKAINTTERISSLASNMQDSLKREFEKIFI